MSAREAPWLVKREVLVKAEEKVDSQYGCRPEERPIRDHMRLGIVNLDKTAGPSSHEVTAWVKRILNLENAGHGGTLEARFMQAREIPT
jgi:H/ACA ribonucleoprotein complex subunit 4